MASRISRSSANKIIPLALGALVILSCALLAHVVESLLALGATLITGLLGAVMTRDITFKAIRALTTLANVLF